MPVPCWIQLKAATDLVEAAAYLAGKSSTGGPASEMRALIYDIDHEDGRTKIAYPSASFEGDLQAGCTLMAVITCMFHEDVLQTDVVESGRISSIYLPPAYLRLFDGIVHRESHHCPVGALWREVGSRTGTGGLMIEHDNITAAAKVVSVGMNGIHCDQLHETPADANSKKSKRKQRQQFRHDWK